MRFFKNYDEPSVVIDFGRFSMVLWYGSLRDWRFDSWNEASCQNTCYRTTIGPLTFIKWTY